MNKPFYTVVCDESNNGYSEELNGIVNADFRFEGVRQVYRVEFAAVEGTPYTRLRQNLFTRLKEVLGRYPDQQVADEIQKALVDSSRAYSRQAR